MKIIKVILLMSLGIVSNNAFSACNATSCSGVGNEALLSVYLNTSGNIYLQAPTGSEALGCTLSDGIYMTLKSSHLLFKETYSTILTALAAQKKLIIRIVSGSSTCEVSYVRMLI